MAKTSRRETFEPGPCDSTFSSVAQASSAGRAQNSTMPLGAPARYGLAQLIHVPKDHFPLATFWTNISGSSYFCLNGHIDVHGIVV